MRLFHRHPDSVLHWLDLLSREERRAIRLSCLRASLQVVLSDAAATITLSDTEATSESQISIKSLQVHFNQQFVLSFYIILAKDGKSVQEQPETLRVSPYSQELCPSPRQTMASPCKHCRIIRNYALQLEGGRSLAGTLSFRVYGKPWLVPVQAVPYIQKPSGTFKIKHPFQIM